MEIRKCPTPPLTLGEGPVWFGHTLCFVDIHAPCVYGYRDGEGIVWRAAMAAPTGFIVPWGEALLAGVGDSLLRLDPATGQTVVVRKVGFPAPLRFNDGKCDPDGRLWAGVMCGDRTRADVHLLGSLTCFAGESFDSLQTLAPMDIPNGMAWTPDGVFYHTDSSRGIVDAYRRLPDGTVCDRRTAIRVPQGVPDGFCTDTEGMLWVALWGAGCVQRFDPHTGQALPQRIDLPERNVSCCCFGGETLTTLYITTAQGDGAPGGLYACDTAFQGTPPYGYGATAR